MNTVTVRASKQYDILIGSGLLPTLGAEAKKLGKARTVCLVSESTVYPLYGKAAEDSLKSAGFSVASYVFPAGESSKNGTVFLALLNFLAENKLTRSDLVAALGGGVVGDLAGFAAASYLRGIRFIQVPTTLLAAVDSSVGGKTAIDLPAGKNLCGAFYQPVGVLCDTDLLQTLPEDIFRDGCAEVIKYGVLGSRDLFDRLAAAHVRDQAEAIVADCVAMKRDVVESDEFDTGRRQFLNLGHTLGHAVEAGSDFRLSHGKSVAIGMALIARAAANQGFCSPETRDELIALLTRYGLPTETDQSPESILRTALGDKKRQGGSITPVVPAEIGRCVLHKIPVEELPQWIEAGPPILA